MVLGSDLFGWDCTHLFRTYQIRGNEKWENDDFDGNMLAAFVSFFWAFAIPTWLIISFIISAGNLLYKFATADHLTEDEQRELKKRQSK